MPEIVLNISQR